VASGSSHSADAVQCLVRPPPLREHPLVPTASEASLGLLVVLSRERLAIDSPVAVSTCLLPTPAACAGVARRSCPPCR